MKKPKDSVFRLIQSMTPAEKRYFKRHYGSSTNLSTQLFDHLNGLSKYEEEMVKQHFGAKVAKNLHQSFELPMGRGLGFTLHFFHCSGTTASQTPHQASSLIALDSVVAINGLDHHDLHSRVCIRPSHWSLCLTGRCEGDQVGRQLDQTMLFENTKTRVQFT